ncbi:MAG: DNA polymerase IV [Gammaproteobacteria bacterium]|nr:DNA polymerase IV [Gammaproteobacteria bacterium]
MDAFYAAVEQLDDPSLRGKPILVGPPCARGVVLTASYEARPYGVGSAMPMALARRRCPDAVVVPPRFERYQEISRVVMRVFREFSPAVEALSLDEAFLDLTGTERLLGPPEAVGRRLKDAVREATGGLDVSVGISSTKFVAKVASGHAKPNGLVVVPPHGAAEWLAPQPIDRLWGVGAKTAARLQALGYERIGDIAAADPDALCAALGGALGRKLHALARADDPREVVPSREAKSIGSEVTLESDTRSRETIAFHLRREADKVARRLRKAGLSARGVRVKLKRADFKLLTRQRMLAAPTDIADELHRAAMSLLDAFGPLPPIRLVGLAAFELDRTEHGGQAEWISPRTRTRTRALEVTLDKLAERFGEGAVVRASALRYEERLGLGPNLDFLRDPEDA